MFFDDHNLSYTIFSGALPDVGSLMLNRNTCFTPKRVSEESPNELWSSARGIANK